MPSVFLNSEVQSGRSINAIWCEKANPDSRPPAADPPGAATVALTPPGPRAITAASLSRGRGGAHPLPGPLGLTGVRPPQRIQMSLVLINWRNVARCPT